MITSEISCLKRPVSEVTVVVKCDVELYSLAHCFAVP